MFEPELKCDNNAIFKQIFTLELLFHLRGKSRFPPKKFITSTTG